MSELKLTFKMQGSLEPRRLAYPPRWAVGPLEYRDVQYNNVFLADGQSVEAAEKWWRDNPPTLNECDAAWTHQETAYIRSELAMGYEVELPMELNSILTTLIEDGPHHVEAPDAYLNTLADMLRPLAYRQLVDRLSNYELQIACGLLNGRIE